MKHITGKSQHRLTKSKLWAKKNIMKFIKEKDLHPGKHNPGVQRRLWSAWLGSSSVKRDLSVLVDRSLIWMNSVLVQQRKSTGCWGASTRASPAKISHYPVVLSACQATPGTLHSNCWISDNKQMLVYLCESMANTPEINHNEISKYFNMVYYLELNFQETVGGGGAINSHRLP